MRTASFGPDRLPLAILADGRVRQAFGHWDTALDAGGDPVRGALHHSQTSDGVVDTYEYDDLGRVDAITRAVGGGAPMWLGIQLDGLGRLDELEYPTLTSDAP